MGLADSKGHLESGIAEGGPSRKGGEPSGATVSTLLSNERTAGWGEALATEHG